MKLFGHPVHVMLIHFPAALLPMDFVCALLGKWLQEPGLAEAGHYAAFGGISLGAAAIATGMFDLVDVSRENSTALNKALIHGGINSVVLIGYLMLMMPAWNAYPTIAIDGNWTLGAKGLLIGAMIFGNYLGGSLVMEHGVGQIRKQG